CGADAPTVSPKRKQATVAPPSPPSPKRDPQDVLKSMVSSPAKLSHKVVSILTGCDAMLMRGGKLKDYSEFEEEEEVDLQNLIGSPGRGASGASASRNTSAASSPSSALGFKASTAVSASTSALSRRAGKEDVAEF
ncbi:hypothetical protein PybrP1_003895, partial [[Pythium] brassicae (nom. inval.)]